MTWAGAWPLLRRFWWLVPLAGLIAWALILRGDLAEARADLSAEQAAHRQSRTNWALATATATAIDLQHRVAKERRQQEESRRIADDYEARIADARARAAAVGVHRPPAAADQGGRRNAPVPGLSDPARVADAAPGENRLPAGPGGALNLTDALIATEQAIQLDALIDYVEAQARVADPGKEQQND
ncbi:MAG: hypothetical protein HEQ22_03320 [Sphingopyxis sp.]|uniref:hypothetical protein n=1 Tax=Sphingopyxis sp. TaxID=1908224 RepID=UPI003D80EFC5